MIFQINEKITGTAALCDQVYKFKQKTGHNPIYVYLTPEEIHCLRKQANTGFQRFEEIEHQHQSINGLQVVSCTVGSFLSRNHIPQSFFERKLLAKRQQF